ncbi:recombinase family protein [Rhodococcus sp. 14-2470-1a]|uniref:recombinase family protein n=1 Tax=Rhodococcus sp. 14-2470-1a TaxID=2023150 RepID=UPI000B9B0130|nr:MULTISPECIES: recombinase family protein [unclassified Rhodococcus (in: high G+C Gram-positive bacteria)]MBJ7325630.1 recombinase family protein [Rhodococcus sp. (in: high G+C Gram-positive bacteria)]OZF41794.1 DNA invertase [Rhodococcus sp. 14-2470-1a]
MSAVLGYMRVSTTDQSLDLQRDALTAAGCFRIWEEVASGADKDRPQLQLLLESLRVGDVVAVWRLDRLGRSLSHLIETVNLIETKGATLRSITEGIDTSTVGGRLTYNIFGSLAEFERDLVKERTMAGLAAARARGRIGGQPAKIDADKARHIRRMLDDGTPKTEIASVLGIGRATLYRHLSSPAG